MLNLKKPALLAAILTTTVLAGLLPARAEPAAPAAGAAAPGDDTEATSIVSRSRATPISASARIRARRKF
jgi:hypothetical protein